MLSATHVLIMFLPDVKSASVNSELSSQRRTMSSQRRELETLATAQLCSDPPRKCLKKSGDQSNMR